MKKITALLLTLIFSLTLTAQEQPSAEEQEAARQAWMEFMTPGEPHKYLTQAEGEWKATNKFWYMPGGESQEEESSATGEMILGGRYLKMTHSGQMMGMPFEGMSFEGYDNAAEKFVSVWIDNMGTGFAIAEGQLDEDGKLIYEGTMSDPLTKEAAWFKQVVNPIDENRIEFEMYMHAPDGSEFKNMEIVYTRK